MHDVRCVFQSGDTIIIAGRSWAIMREMPTSNGTLAQFFVREDRWDCVIAQKSAYDNNTIFCDPHTIADLAYTPSAERVGQVCDYPDLATVSPTVAEHLATAPHDAPVEALDWEDRVVYRVWWATEGTVTTVLVVEDWT